MFYPRFPENVTFYFISIAYKQSKKSWFAKHFTESYTSISIR